MDEASIQQVCCCERGRDGETEVRSGSKGERKNGGMERGEKEDCRCGNKNGWIRDTHMQRWRFSGELTYFSNECIQKPTCVTDALKHKVLRPNRDAAD